MESQVVLVDKADHALGTMEKHEAHEKGLLHRSFSIVIMNEKQQMLLQKRAMEKYHSPGLWSNACCSHPKPDENIIDAGQRRLIEEMGFSCSLREIFNFTYKAVLEHPFIEYEYDHVLLGRYHKDPKPEPFEVAAWKWMNIPQLLESVRKDSDQFTCWFKLILDQMADRAML